MYESYADIVSRQNHVISAFCILTGIDADVIENLITRAIPMTLIWTVCWLTTRRFTTFAIQKNARKNSSTLSATRSKNSLTTTSPIVWA